MAAAQAEPAASCDAGSVSPAPLLDTEGRQRHIAGVRNDDNVDSDGAILPAALDDIPSLDIDGQVSPVINHQGVAGGAGTAPHQVLRGKALHFPFQAAARTGIPVGRCGPPLGPLLRKDHLSTLEPLPESDELICSTVLSMKQENAQVTVQTGTADPENATVDGDALRFRFRWRHPLRFPDMWGRGTAAPIGDHGDRDQKAQSESDDGSTLTIHRSFPIGWTTQFFSPPLQLRFLPSPVEVGPPGAT